MVYKHEDDSTDMSHDNNVGGHACDPCLVHESNSVVTRHCYLSPGVCLGMMVSLPEKFLAMMT
jgi:hypothetical protein